MELDVGSYKDLGVYQQNIGCLKITDCIRTLFFLGKMGKHILEINLKLST